MSARMWREAWASWMAAAQNVQVAFSQLDDFGAMARRERPQFGEHGDVAFLVFEQCADVGAYDDSDSIQGVGGPSRGRGNAA